MHIKLIQTDEELQQLETAWNALLEQGATRVPFLRHEYLSAWWQTRGGGEWPQARLAVLAGYQDDQQLMGIAPLFQTQNLEGELALLLLGSIQISDYLDVITRREHLEPFLEAVLGYLNGPQAPEWELLDLYNLQDSSPTLESLRSAANRLGMKFEQQQLQVAPFIQLPQSFDDYLANIDKKQRHEIRRKIRRAESGEAEVRWYIVENPASLDDEIDAFLHLMAASPEKEAFLTEVMRTQMRQAVHAAFQAGWLQLAFIEINGEKAAAYLNFDYAGRIYVYNSGLNFDFGYYSPGWVLLAYLIEWAIQNNRQIFDFMRGDEQYKYRFGGVNQHVYRVQIRRATPPQAPTT